MRRKICSVLYALALMSIPVTVEASEIQMTEIQPSDTNTEGVSGNGVYISENITDSTETLETPETSETLETEKKTSEELFADFLAANAGTSYSDMTAEEIVDSFEDLSGKLDEFSQAMGMNSMADLKAMDIDTLKEELMSSVKMDAGSILEEIMGSSYLDTIVELQGMSGFGDVKFETIDDMNEEYAEIMAEFILELPDIDTSLTKPELDTSISSATELFEDTYVNLADGVEQFDIPSSFSISESQSEFESKKSNSMSDFNDSDIKQRVGSNMERSYDLMPD